MDNIDWNNKIEVLKVVLRHGWVLRFASDELKNDKDVVMAAVSNYAASLEFASDELKNDKEIVLEAVSYKSIALFYASAELRNDYTTMKELFMLTMESYYNSNEYIFYDEKIIFNYILSKSLKKELHYIKKIYNYDSYTQVCEYIKRTDEIKKFSWRMPLLDTKFRFI
jgi:hypothetical protein